VSSAAWHLETRRPFKLIPRGLVAGGHVMQGVRSGVDLSECDIDRARNHLANYYKTLGDETPAVTVSTGSHAGVDY
jgi:hypothetical protein